MTGEELKASHSRALGAYGLKNKSQPGSDLDLNEIEQREPLGFSINA